MKIQIKEEIERYGLNFFEGMKNAVLEEGTKPEPYFKDEHDSNKIKLINKIEEVVSKYI